jgi:hypothetical protein
MLIIPAPSYSLVQAVWIPRITIWRDDGTTQRRESTGSLDRRRRTSQDYESDDGTQDFE